MISTPAEDGVRTPPAGWLHEATRRHPRRLFWSFAALHLAVWSAVPALVQPNLPLDIIELLVWGREWQLAFFKHPPLVAWIIEAFAALTGHWDRALFALSPLAIVIALWAIWKLSSALIGPEYALLAVLAQEGVVYFNLTSPEFNHNVVQMPLWALLGWSGYCALKRDRLSDWLLLGLWAGLGMLGKYSTALLLLSMGLFLCLHPGARGYLRTPRPYLAAAVCLALLAPHLHAVQQIDFRPFANPFQRAGAATSGLDHLWFPLKFMAAQLLDISAALILLGCLLLGRGGAVLAARRLEPLDRHYVATVALAPIALALLISGGLGLDFRSMWGTPMWGFVGLFGLVFVVREVRPRGLRLFTRLWPVAFVGFAMTFALIYAVGPYLGYKDIRGHFAGPEMAAAIAKRWSEATGQRPLSLVAGDAWLAGNIAFYGPDRPTVFIDGDPVKSPWIDLAKARRDGALLVWEGALGVAAPPSHLRALFPGALVQPAVELPWKTGADHPPVRVGWAIVPPEAARP
jgi:4-amino-4-deoxy-L-arabinose transferase-like glycosyltransferase